MSTYPIAMASYISVALVLFTIANTVYAGPGFVPVAQLMPVQEVPRPYEFGYEFGDALGMNQHRREVADGTGVVKGNYGYQDPNGVYRRVEYTADADGYRTVVHSNEPGLTSHTSGSAVYVVELPPPAVVKQGLRSALPSLPV